MELPTPAELREARRARGLTQAELASEAGVSQPLLSRIENHDVDPRLTTVHRIAAAMNGVSPVEADDAVEVATRSHLKARRESAGLTQAELAERAGVSQPLIARIETEGVNPRLSTLRSIFDAFPPESTQEGRVVDETDPDLTADQSGVDESAIMNRIAASFKDL